MDDEREWEEPTCPECGEPRLWYRSEGWCKIDFAVTGVADNLQFRGYRMDVTEIEEDLNGEVYFVQCEACDERWEGRAAMDVIYDQAPRRPRRPARGGGGRG